MKHFSLIIFIVFLISCSKKDQLFTEVDSAASGLHFNNKIVENDSMNPIDVTNVYNGGGVGIGDFNNDGLKDIYLTGNMVEGRLYLNNGTLTFRDITKEAGIDNKGRWERGVAIIDINNDGLDDIYISATLKSDPKDRKNMLYVNQGIKQNNTPTFKELSNEYGLDDDGQSTQAAFFDYDNDGDLDVYVVTNAVNPKGFPDNFRVPMRDGLNPSTGRLYRNDWSDSLKHGFYKDVSKEAGIQTEGYGHSVHITDINQDGWKDIYVTNDFVTNDLLWINNQNGTFSEQLSVYFKHTSANAMGTDIVDINNDGLDDVISLDMDPEDNFRKKMMLNANSYQRYQNSDRFNYNYQYVRNTLQLNQGNRVGENDSIGVPVFSEIGFLAGIAETDWSWTPLVSDFDNDGYRDVIITNGYPKDVTDHDFINFRGEATNIAPKEYILSQIPEVKIKNYAYRNNSDLTFKDVTNEWGLNKICFSNGATYVDLDNDGDLEVVINNINSEVTLYKNNSREKKPEETHFLKVHFKGEDKNIKGIGAYATIYYDEDKKQFWEHTPYRGYLSSVDEIAFFGLGKTKKIDSVKIDWPGNRYQILKDVRIDTILSVNIKDAKVQSEINKNVLTNQSYFSDITSSRGIHFNHREKDFVDFNIQKLLPHKFSEFGPGIATGDIDQNGTDDFIIGGSTGYSAQIFLQQQNGSFKERLLTTDTGFTIKKSQDLGLLLFDADNDQDLDLYITSGGFSQKSESEIYQDRFYANDGKGNFKLDTNALPINKVSKFAVKAADFDKDGDLDLFISGRVDPWNYPKPVSSFIYRNDSKNGKIAFTDVTNNIAKDLINIGMVCDGLFTDFDNDGWIDLVLAGEWMPVTFLKNEKGIFKNITKNSGISNYVGWWNAIVSGDFDNDGDLDYVIGNIGENTLYKASEKYPVSVYADDYDKNGSYDAIPSIYFPASMEDKTKKEFPVFGRDDLIKQMFGMRSKFQSYRHYATSTMDSVLTKEQIKNSLIYRANILKSALIINQGNGTFKIEALPVEAQFSTLCGMISDDVNGDGNLDLIINGNDYSPEVFSGRNDALNGLVMIGDGKGHFKSLKILESGLYIPGNGKAIVKLKDAKGGCIIAASQNRGPVKLFKYRLSQQIVPLKSNDISIAIQFKNGKKQIQEIYFGQSYLSESSRIFSISNNIQYIQIKNSLGQMRTIMNDKSIN